MFYVGSHHGQENDGYVGSSRRFKYAYKKRPHDFKRRILEYNYINDRSSTLKLEQRWLNFIKQEELNIRYYNLNRCASGGYLIEGFTDDQLIEYKLKISKSGLGKKRSRETRAKMGEANKKREFSSETRAKIGKAAHERPPEVRQKMREARRRRVTKPETRIKLRQAHQGRKRPPFSETWKENIRQGQLKLNARRREAASNS